MTDYRDSLVEDASRLIDTLNGRLDLCRKLKEHYLSQIRSLEQQLETEKVDARRYRWLRENIGMDDGLLITYEPGELDFLIDGELEHVVVERRLNAG